VSHINFVCTSVHELYNYTDWYHWYGVHLASFPGPAWLSVACSTTRKLGGAWE